MNRYPYYKQMEKIIAEHVDKSERKKLLLHCCCAPCSSHCLELLREFFDVTVFFYNPNISPEAEYNKRIAEEIRLIEAYNGQVEKQDFAGMKSTESASKIDYICGEYEPQRFFDEAKGYEDCPEGGDRCRRCFRLRLSKSADTAARLGFDYLTTSLTISPLKNADALNEIGQEEADRAGVLWLPSDFKKKEGYKRSIELSAQFDLYRQDFCGCVYSRAERERQKRL